LLSGLFDFSLLKKIFVDLITDTREPIFIDLGTDAEQPRFGLCRTIAEMRGLRLGCCSAIPDVHSFVLRLCQAIPEMRKLRFRLRRAIPEVRSLCLCSSSAIFGGSKLTGDAVGAFHSSRTILFCLIRRIVQHADDGIGRSIELFGHVPAPIR